MTAVRRVFIFVAYGVFLAAFWAVPGAAGFTAEDRVNLAATTQLLGPLVAAICCAAAAWKSRGRDRLAWTGFAAGSGLYLAGNLGYAAYNFLGITPDFPSLPEASYLLMAVVFGVGMFAYGNMRRRISRVQFFNFILVYSALTLAVLFLLHDHLERSTLSPLGTIAALVYPSLWLSVAAFGIISVAIYQQGEKAFPFSLLLCAVSAEAVADYIYAQELLDGTYQLGGITQLLWVASAGLIGWAAIEQVGVARRQTEEPEWRRSGRSIVEAAVPAAAIAIILVAGAISGTLSNSMLVGVAIVLAIVFAAATGLREHWIIHTQRQLRSAVEKSRAQLAQSEQRMTSVLRSTSDSVLVLDLEGRVEFYNDQALRTLRLEGRLKLGDNLGELFPEFVDSRTNALFAEAIRTQQPVEFEEFFPHENSWLEIHVYPTPEGISIFFRDISESRRSREEMAHMAHHDPLTGLANRALFQQRLREAVESGEPSATLLLDLDNFKEVNDSLGHPVGDRLLAETARRLIETLRPQDTIARLGGDEFAIILHDRPKRSEIAVLARRLLKVTGKVHDDDGDLITVGASIGIALSEGLDGNADHILRAADIALYAAKSEARGTFRFFEPAMETDLLQRRTLRGELALAVERNEFELAYQPLIDLHSGRVSGFEALIRWRHPDKGLVPPDVFIPIAEESGLINPIGEWVLRTACAEASTWPGETWVAVNLSSRQFRTRDLAGKVKSAMAAAKLDSHRLELEITESVLLEDTKSNMATLLELKGLGLRIALDDFGTGYSSLGYLKRFPFSKIKIDRSFISGLPENDESKAIVKMVIGLGKSLGMLVTAEGVETAAQLDWVKRGCDEAQGYLISRPVPASQIPALLERLGAVTGRETLREAG